MKPKPSACGWIYKFKFIPPGGMFKMHNGWEGCARERCRWQIKRAGKQVPRSTRSKPALAGAASVGHRKRNNPWKSKTVGREEPSQLFIVGNFITDPSRSQSTARGS